MNEVNILKPPPAFAGDARPRVGAAPEEPQPAPVPPPAPAPPEALPKRRRVYGDLLVVLALTLLGGVLRFMFIDRPPLWGDDGFTFMRVCGTYQQMLDALQDWGFAPLHYELLWWIGRQTTLTPFYMRLVPAVTGTLMIPAMYWLGRELVDRKVGLVAALFAATSAYLLNYSRDAKMYMPFWFFAALNFACLLWWLRTRGGVAWWSWVASGVAMLGLNMIGAVVLGIELAAVLLARRAYWTSLGKLLLLIPWVPVTLLNGTLRLVGAGPQERPPLDWWFNRAMANFRWPPLALFVLGAAIMFVGPYGYYAHFNRYKEKIENRGGGLEAGGLGWINGYNRGRDALDLVTFTTTAHLYSWEWPRYDEKLRIDDGKEINPRALRWLKIAGVAILGVLALGLFPWPRAWTAFRPTEPAAPPRVWPWSRALAVVVLWIVVPAYAFYCASVPGFRSPLEVIANVALEDLARVDWPTVYDVAWWPFEGKGFWAKLSVAWPAFASQFASSNLRRPTGALQWAMLVTAALGVLAALYFSGRSVRERLYKLTILVTIALAVYVLCWFVYLLYVQKYRGSVWMPRYLGFAWPALALAVAVLLLRLPTRPLRWSAVALLVGVNLCVFGARLFAGTEPPTPLMARDLVDSQPANATVRMYYNVRQPNGGPPGSGYLYSLPGSYYLTILSGKPSSPQEFLSGFNGGQIAAKFKRWNVSVVPLPQYVANDVKKTPRLEKLIVWENFTPKRQFPADDAVLARLGDTWRRSDEELFHVRDHWTWRNLMTLRRRTYERVGPATQPSTQPATIPVTHPATQSS